MALTVNHLKIKKNRHNKPESSITTLKIIARVTCIRKRCLCKAASKASFLRTELGHSLCIISVRAQSCDRCHGCHHSLVSPLCAGDQLPQCQRARRGAACLFSHSPVPFLGLLPLAGLLLPASTSSVCSGTKLLPLWKKEKKTRK